MASLTKAINKDLFDSILPTFGNQRVHIPVWDEGQKMFLCEEYESASGNRYYKGVRFCDRIVVVEKVGLYHNWTYIDGIEVYAFNGTRLEWHGVALQVLDDVTVNARQILKEAFRQCTVFHYQFGQNAEVIEHEMRVYPPNWQKK